MAALSSLKWKSLTGGRGWLFYGRDAEGVIKGTITFTFFSASNGGAFVPNTRRSAAEVEVRAPEHGMEEGPLLARFSSTFNSRNDADKWARAIARDVRAGRRTVEKTA